MMLFLNKRKNISQQETQFVEKSLKNLRQFSLQILDKCSSNAWSISSRSN